MLGNRLNISEADQLAYVIDGFENLVLQTQAGIKKFQNVIAFIEG